MALTPPERTVFLRSAGLAGENWGTGHWSSVKYCCDHGHMLGWGAVPIEACSSLGVIATAGCMWRSGRVGSQEPAVEPVPPGTQLVLRERVRQTGVGKCPRCPREKGFWAGMAGDTWMVSDSTFLPLAHCICTLWRKNGFDTPFPQWLPPSTGCPPVFGTSKGPVSTSCGAARVWVFCRSSPQAGRVCCVRGLMVQGATPETPLGTFRSRQGPW